MRHLLVTLAILSLGVRWADAGCGCAEHNVWFAMAEGVDDHGHDRHAPAGPAFDHGCDGECGRAIYASGARVQTALNFSAPVALVCATPVLIGPKAAERLSPSGPPPARAALSVYRI